MNTAPPTAAAGDASSWSGRRRGNLLGFWIFSIATRLTGLRGAYGLLYLVCPYYLLFDRPAVAAAFAYLRRRFPGRSGWRLRVDVFRLFINLGRALIDRNAALFRTGLFRIEFPSPAHLGAQLASDKGVILLLAHVGNWQLALGALPRVGRAVTLVMRPEDNPAVASNLRVNPAGEGLRILTAGGDAASVIHILQRIEAGDVVCLMADRSYQFRSAAVPFLGDTARMPMGPYQLARSAGCPVLFLSTHRAGHRHYVMEVENIPPPDEGAETRSGYLAAWAGRFAARLEDFAQRHPYQVFLFHDIWSTDPASAVDNIEKR